MHLRSVLAGLVTVLIAACGVDSGPQQNLLAPPAPPIAVANSDGPLRGQFDVSVSVRERGKTDLCHREGNGGFHLISISGNAVAAHLRHGDGAPGQAVPGNLSKKFDGTCALIDSVVCPSRFTREALQDLNTQFGDLGSTYDFVSTNVVTQVSSRSDVADRSVNRFVIFQAPGPDWPQAFVSVTRVYDPGFAVLYNEELPVTAEQAAACVRDLQALARVLGVL